jgi:hypothetical protein
MGCAHPPADDAPERNNERNQMERDNTTGIDDGNGCGVYSGLSVGQTIVLLGEMQLQVDRMVESPGGAWDTVVNLGEIACALRTASARHCPQRPYALVVAKEMLDQLLVVSRMSEDQKEHAARGFQCAKNGAGPADEGQGPRGGSIGQA